MIIVAQAGTQLRAYEKPNLEKHFGDVVTCKPDAAWNIYKDSKAEYLYWRPDTERTNKDEWKRMFLQEMELTRRGVKIINPVMGFENAQSKDSAFRNWERARVPCPGHKILHKEIDIRKQVGGWKYPILIRLNNSVTGYESYLCNSMNELEGNWEKLKRNFDDPKYGGGIDCRMMAVQYVRSTSKMSENEYNMSYRIIVAGDKVITGYARLSDSEDWIAITKKFNMDMVEDWVAGQRACQRFVEFNYNLIIKAVHSLGLNFQGVDVILKDGNNSDPYFLEVQPGFSAGYLNQEQKGWLPPFYNPSQPLELVQFLIKNEDRLLKEIPIYYVNWLDKNILFDRCFGTLKGYLNGNNIKNRQRK